MGDFLAYPADTSWVIPTAAVLLLVSSVLITGLAVWKVVRRNRQATKGRAMVRRSQARARYERHQAAKALVRFVPSDDSTDTR